MKCKNCHTDFSGIVCPRCGMPARAVPEDQSTIPTESSLGELRPSPKPPEQPVKREQPAAARPSAGSQAGAPVQIEKPQQADNTPPAVPPSNPNSGYNGAAPQYYTQRPPVQNPVPPQGAMPQQNYPYQPAPPSQYAVPAPQKKNSPMLLIAVIVLVVSLAVIAFVLFAVLSNKGGGSRTIDGRETSSEVTVPKKSIKDYEKVLTTNQTGDETLLDSGTEYDEIMKICSDAFVFTMDDKNSIVDIFLPVEQQGRKKEAQRLVGETESLMKALEENDLGGCSMISVYYITEEEMLGCYFGYTLLGEAVGIEPLTFERDNAFDRGLKEAYEDSTYLQSITAGGVS